VGTGIRSGSGQVTVSGQCGTEPTPRVERCLVEGIAARTQLRNQRDTVDHNRNEYPPLPLGQILLHGTPDRNDQVTPLGMIGRADPESVRQPLPVRGVEGNSGSLPEMLA
jgi:hypothetical protein